MKSVFILAILLFCQMLLAAQGRTPIDSLNIWAFAAISKDPAQAREWAEEALSQSQQTHNNKEEAYAQIVLGILAKNQGEYSEAESRFLLALDIRNKIGDKEGVASCYNNLGNLFKDKDSGYETAGNYFLKGLKNLEGLEPTAIEGIVCNNYGEVLRRQFKHKEALDMLERGLSVRESLGDRTGVANSLLNLGVLYEEMANYPAARKKWTQALKIYEEESNLKGQAKCLIQFGNLSFYQKDWAAAADFYLKAQSLENAISPEDKALIHYNLGSTMIRQGQYRSVPYHLSTSQEIYSGLKMKEDVASVLFEWGNLYYELSSFDSALIFYHRSLDTIRTLLAPRLKSDLALHLSLAYSQIGKYEDALHYNKQYTSLMDSIYRNDRDALISQRNLEEAKREMEVEKRNRLKIFSIIGFIVFWLLLFIAVLSAYLNRSKRRIAEQNEEIANQQLLDTVNKMELEAQFARWEGENAERKRISSELHDEIGALLATVKIHLESIDHQIFELRKENHSHFQEANHLVNQAYDEVKQLAQELRKGNFGQHGLDDQLSILATRIRNTGKFEVELITHGLDEPRHPELDMKIYRTVQELVSNVIRHANATRIGIQVNHFDDLINIVVEDDGIGFDSDIIKKASGIGWQNIRERIDDLGGGFVIDNQKNSGTTIIIDIPLPKRK